MANKNFNQDQDNQNQEQKDKKQQQEQREQRERQGGQQQPPDVKDPLRKGQTDQEKKDQDTDIQE